MQEILLAVANLTKRWYCVYTQWLQGSDDGINTSLYLNHSDLEVQNSYICCKGAFKNIDHAKTVRSLSIVGLQFAWTGRAQINHYQKITYN